MTAFLHPHAHDEDAPVVGDDSHTQPDSSLPPSHQQSPPQRSLDDGDLCALYRRELEEERNAAEIAANEAISMIVRLQVEKAALQMELSHYQRLFATRSSYDQATITQLQAIISKQEADKQALVRELVRCKHPLINDSGNNIGKADPVWCTPLSCIDDPVSAIESFPGCEAVTTSFRKSCCDGMIDEVENLETLGSNDEATTKHVISFGVTSPMSKQYYSRLNDRRLEDMATNQDKEYDGNCIDANCYSDDVSNGVMNTNRLMSDGDAHGRHSRSFGKSENISSNVSRHYSEKIPFLATWNETKNVLKGDLAICESQLCVLEAVRESMIGALSAMRTVEKPEIMLVMATDLLEECTSFANLGSNILTSLNKLIECLKGIVQIVKEERTPEITLESDVPKSAIDGEGEKLDNHSTNLDDSVISDIMESGIDKIAYLWSIGLQWMNNDRCRADTAFSGWDH